MEPLQRIGNLILLFCLISSLRFPKPASTASISMGKDINSTETKDKFSDSLSNCSFPPRDMFLNTSAEKDICANTYDPSKATGIFNETTASLCLALKFASERLCYNDSIMSTLQKLNTSALLASNKNSTVESFCSEFQKSVRVLPEDSTPEIDKFFASFFEKSMPNSNRCIEMCDESNNTLRINVLCTLTNAAFEMIQLLNLKPGETKDIGHLPEDSSAPKSMSQVKDVPAEGPETDKSPSPVVKTSDKEEPLPVPVSPVALPAQSTAQDQNPPPLQTQEATSKESINAALDKNPDPKGETTQEQVPSKNSANANPLNEDNVVPKPPVEVETPKTGNDKPSFDPLEKETDSADGMPPDLEVESAESILTDQAQDSPDIGNRVPGLKQNFDKMKDKKQAKDNSNTFQKVGSEDYKDFKEEESSGYFGYFLTFVGISCFCFVIFHNKKRLIALVIEGRKPRGGRRRSGSGAAAYRKLENNFE